MKRFITICVAFMAISCTSGNLDNVKENASDVWEKQGFEIVGYEGYQWGFWGLTSYGGAKVWHRLKRTPDNGVIYSGFIQRWGDEYHVYGPKAHDAFVPQR